VLITKWSLVNGIKNFGSAAVLVNTRSGCSWMNYC
jgi:hypothetical protein